MSLIQDFGEKIGGARKDLWKHRGLDVSDLSEMTDLERSTLIKKENVWPKPDWIKLISDGTPQCVAYWQSKMRQVLPPRPAKADPECQENYVETVRKFRDAVMNVKTPAEIDQFYHSVLRNMFMEPSSVGQTYYILPQALGTITSKVINTAQQSSYRMKKEAERKLFGIPQNQQVYVQTKNNMSVHCYDGEQVTLTEDEYIPRNLKLTMPVELGKLTCYIRKGKPFSDPAEWETDTYFIYYDQRGPLKINFQTEREALDYVEAYARDAQKQEDLKRSESRTHGKSKKKSSFVPPQLQHLNRTGPDYRNHREANSRMFLKELGFRGGEFGNYLNANDRQASLTMAYDALRDLSRILQIRPEDVSLNGSLAIAFGARGKGGINAGAAHYEPGRQVINLTKMSGAGCLAHEWGHALDHALGISLGSTGLASAERCYKLPPAFRDVLQSMRHKTITVPKNELARELQPKIEHCKTNIRAWIDGEKPKHFSPELEQTWANAVDNILSSVEKLTGAEYMQAGRGKDVKTMPEIEFLSQIKKAASNHSLSRSVKQQIILWGMQLKEYESKLSSIEPAERLVETDFYKGSRAFDGQYTRMGHGYWSSECEMFARAFDCYISDKLKEDGNKSEYLSAYANAFRFQDPKTGELISAVPLGEEREILNQKFDALIIELKERGLLTQFLESRSMPIVEQPSAANMQKAPRPTQHTLDSAGQGSRRVRYEQMSFEELFRSAEERKTEQQHIMQSPSAPER